LSLGVGGVFKFLSGRTKRAPDWMQRWGLEWCFRWMQDPKGLSGRYLKDLLVFPLLVVLAFRERLAGYRGQTPPAHGTLSQQEFPGLIRMKLPAHMTRDNVKALAPWMDVIHPQSHVVIDCGAVRSLDSSGVGVLLDIARQTPKDHLHWIGILSPLMSRFKAYRIDDLVQNRHDSLEAICDAIIQSQKRLKILLIIEQCNPEGFSVPLVGYQFFEAIRQYADVTLVTSDRHQGKFAVKDNVVFIPQGFFGRLCERSAAVVTKSRVAEWNWALRHLFSYPAYAEFDRSVYRCFAERVRAGDFDIVHAIPPILPRYPVKLVRACEQVPFVLGPVNGGIPFPKGFETVAKREFDGFRLLRKAVRFLPGYTATYRQANAVLCGSQHVLVQLQTGLGVDPARLQLMSENGISEHFLFARSVGERGTLRCLYVGRLVPFKQVDVVIEALHELPLDVSLTIVGQGPEEERLRQLTTRLGLEAKVRFCGWVKVHETRDYYSDADLFCTASIREFGGAVVLEAMACSLPCLVTDYGGIAEYVDDACGVKILPTSREQMVQDFRQQISRLARDRTLLQKMSRAAFERAKQYTWRAKGQHLIALYHALKH
jgi:glycosyltransferase involved in cell wall biosynthesis